ncbi:hypothetical protein GALMADRAFT_158789, partial [Galerina marginata CBS 339.88]
MQFPAAVLKPNLNIMNTGSRIEIMTFACKGFTLGTRLPPPLNASNSSNMSIISDLIPSSSSASFSLRLRCFHNIFNFSSSEVPAQGRVENPRRLDKIKADVDEEDPIKDPAIRKKIDTLQLDSILVKADALRKLGISKLYFANANKSISDQLRQWMTSSAFIIENTKTLILVLSLL